MTVQNDPLGFKSVQETTTKLQSSNTISQTDLNEQRAQEPIDQFNFPTSLNRDVEDEPTPIVKKSLKIDTNMSPEGERPVSV